MDQSEEELEEDDNEWRTSYVDSFPPSPAPAAVSGCSSTKTPPGGLTSAHRVTKTPPGGLTSAHRVTKTPPGGLTSAHRVILHFDLDCFYAQVEMIRNPALREVPLGIQQKYIIVTCNYVARALGVTKLMSVSAAKEKCPQLVLVKGEDLTHYREMSYRMTELLMSSCPLVERLGFDENFMDVTSMVETRLAQISDSDQISFKGHVYNHSSADVEARDHPRLALGSEIAAELREVIHSKLGLTGCAGIATNKLLAKLVSGAFKPNQQTTLLPENVSDIMGCLGGLRKVPGVGHQTAKRLQALGLVSVEDLQRLPLNDLVREFGAPTAQRLKNLSLGVDDSPVTPTGAPQSLSDEDSFKKMSSTEEVLEKIKELLSSLLERMHKDGRQPQTFRLTVRKYSATNKWFSRESRQGPIPNHIGQKISSGCSEDAVQHLVPLAMKLFHKMVDSSAAFHLTLINVCFSNLQSRGAAAGDRGSITSFFTSSSSPRKTQSVSSQNQDDSSAAGDGLCADQETSQRTETLRSSGESFHGCKRRQSSVVGAEDPLPLKVSCSTARSDHDEAVDTMSQRLPPNVDPEVFRLLPEDIQKELLSSDSLPNPPTSSSAAEVSRPHKTPLLFKGLQNAEDVTQDKLKPLSPAGQSLFPGAHVMEEESSDCQFPGNVDPQVFSELPADVQKELLAQWKQQRPSVKMPLSRKGGKSSMAKDGKAAGRSRQTNNLFKYFKPS